MDDKQTSQIYIDLGKRIRIARNRKLLNQSDLADILAVGRTSVANIESGRQRPPIHIVYKIAFTLEMDVSELFPPVPLDEMRPVQGLSQSVKEQLDGLTVDGMEPASDLKNWIVERFTSRNA